MNLQVELIFKRQINLKITYFSNVLIYSKNIESFTRDESKYKQFSHNG